MLYHISKLKQSEQELVRNVPILVSILIAGSDGVIEKNEIEKALKTIHTKSFSETSDIRYLYKDIENNAENAMNNMLKSLPEDHLEREAIITAELTKLNEIFPKLDKNIAIDFYKSLRNFAVQVANTSGGVLGVMKINYNEKEMLKLPMIKNPESE
ncbi:MAG: hypothetical protein HUU47_01000 [Bacteroidetes bacterium]|nr:hypothetical protein [Bacteroidota bacterium]